jgi:membrane-associated phospholipid phosphatase
VKPAPVGGVFAAQSPGRRDDCWEAARSATTDRSANADAFGWFEPRPATSVNGARMDLLSGLGDVAVVAPASAAVVVGLLWLGAKRDATAFAVAILACMALTFWAKLAFAACGFAPRFGVESPSGHAALGAAFYGSLAALLAGGRRLGVRLALYGAAACASLAVAYGRVELGVHSVGEAICGLLIGAVAAALFMALRGAPRRLSVTPQMLVRASPIALLLALDLALFTDRWTAESVIDRLAAAIGVALRLCS